MVDTINELASLASKLNQKSDSLTQSINTINEKLAKLNLGVEAWTECTTRHTYYRDEDENNRYPLRDETWLGYAKVNDVWQLATKDVTLGTDERRNRFEEVVESDPPSALLQSSRSVRVSAMSCIPSLLNALKHQAESALAGIEAAAEAAEKL